MSGIEIFHLLDGGALLGDLITLLTMMVVIGVAIVLTIEPRRLLVTGIMGGILALVWVFYLDFLAERFLTLEDSAVIAGGAVYETLGRAMATAFDVMIPAVIFGGIVAVIVIWRRTPKAQLSHPLLGLGAAAVGLLYFVDWPIPPAEETAVVETAVPDLQVLVRTMIVAALTGFVIISQTQFSRRLSDTTRIAISRVVSAIVATVLVTAIALNLEGITAAVTTAEGYEQNAGDLVIAALMILITVAAMRMGEKRWRMPGAGGDGSSPTTAVGDDLRS